MQQRFKLALGALVLIGVGATQTWSQPPKSLAAPTGARGPALLEHLNEKYPKLESRVLNAVLTVQKSHPGLVYSVPKNLINDLDGEVLPALLDVWDAVAQAYPDAPRRIAQMVHQHGPRQAVRAMLRSNYPGLRTEVLAYAASHPSPLSAARKILQQTREEKFPGLGPTVRLDMSKWLDQQGPEINSQLGSRASLAELMLKNPKFAREALKELERSHGQEIRAAVLASLSSLESNSQADPAGWLGGLASETFQKHPDLAHQWAKTKLGSRSQLRSQILQEFPELPNIVRKTLRERHPDLLAKAAASLRQHYPGLKEEFRAALEQELPGIEVDLRKWLGDHPRG
jgi:hypothetical protein